MNQHIVEKNIAELVSSIYESPAAVKYPYHNLAHTKRVVAHVKELVAYYSLNEANTLVLILSAWFHDIGHLYGEMKGHEERGVVIMQHYLQNVPKELVTAISGCILATKIPSHPASLREQIICDADTYHLGTSFFQEADALVKEEIEMRTGKKIPDWHQKSLSFLQQHTFYTEYCLDLLNEGKLQNIAWLESQID